jgi:hypothetical protein
VATEKLTMEFQKPIIDMAKPLSLFGNISESRVHITGPIEMANDATNMIRPIRTHTGLIEMECFRMLKLGFSSS